MAATRKYAARTLLANSASNVSGFRSAVAPNQENPALLTRTSTSGVGGQALYAAGVAEVGRGEPGGTARLLDLPDNPGAAGGVATVHDDLEAVAAQGHRDDAAEARGRAGHQGQVTAVTRAILIRHVCLLRESRLAEVSSQPARGGPDEGVGVTPAGPAASAGAPLAPGRRAIAPAAPARRAAGGGDDQPPAPAR